MKGGRLMSDSNRNVLSKAIDIMMDDIDDIAYKAAIRIKHKMNSDFLKAAKNAVDTYYLSYTPSQYNREEHLYDTYKVTTKMKTNPSNGTYEITTNVLFTPDELEGVYHTNSSKHGGGGSWADGGDVEASWVFSNFAEGRHPYTTYEFIHNEDGSWGVEYHYETIDDSVTPREIIEEFSKKYNTQYFDKYVKQELVNELQRYVDSAF